MTPREAIEQAGIALRIRATRQPYEPSYSLGDIILAFTCFALLEALYVAGYLGAFF